MAVKATYEELEKRVAELEERLAFQQHKHAPTEIEFYRRYRSPSFGDEILFEDFFVVDEIQQLQDEFAKATGVASIIIRKDGTPITKASNFTRLCRDFPVLADKGWINCCTPKPKASLKNEDSIVIKPGIYGGLREAGAVIRVGGRDVAIWLIGQVRDDSEGWETLGAYARELGLDEGRVMDAFAEIPSMPLPQFKKVARLLSAMAERLSTSAYQKNLQANFIAEQIRVEKELLQSKEKYRALVESSSDLIWEVDAEGVYTYVSPQVKNVLGFTPAEIIGKTAFEIMEEKEGERIKEIFFAAASKANPLKGLVNTIPHKDGHLVVLETNGRPIMGSDGILVGYRGVDRDITFRRQAEEALFDREKQLRLTLDATPFPIAMADLTGENIHFWSHSALLLFGHTAATASRWYTIAYPDPGYRREVIEQWESHLVKAKKTDKPVHAGEYSITCKDGSLRVCELYATYLPNALIVTFNDITQKKRADDELVQYQEHLEELVNIRTAALALKNKELETFTYSVSHDLKAPLRGIDGYSRLLEEECGAGLDEEGLLFLSNIRHAANQMNELIEDLLQYSRMERKSLQNVKIDIRALIDSIVAQRTHDIKESKISLTIDVPFETVESDFETIRQILTNYLDNAIKYRKPDTTGTVHIGGSQDQSFWTLWVKDSGIGFDLKYVDLIFEIFQRLHHVEDYPGTGIGLAIVRKAVERIGGTVHAESVIGEGSTFYLNIPKESDFIYKERLANES